MDGNNQSARLRKEKKVHKKPIPAKRKKGGGEENRSGESGGESPRSRYLTKKLKRECGPD